MTPGSGERDGTTVKEVYLRVLEATIEAAKQEFEKSALHYTASAGLKELRSLWESKLTASEHELDFPAEFFSGDSASYFPYQSSLQTSTLGLAQHGVPQTLLNKSAFTFGAVGNEFRRAFPNEPLSKWSQPIYTGEQSFTSVQDESGPIGQRKEYVGILRGRVRDTESITVDSSDPTSSFTTTRSYKRGGDKRSFSTRESTTSHKDYSADKSSSKRARIEERDFSREEEFQKEENSEESLDSELSGSDTELVDSVDNEEVSLLFSFWFLLSHFA